MATLLRLEGLVAGGAVGSYEGCFLEHLRQLRDPLLEQMGDRRSAVARQAAHTMEMLAAALGIRFEPYAVTFMTALFKALVITVQVGLVSCFAVSLHAANIDIMALRPASLLQAHPQTQCYGEDVTC